MNSYITHVYIKFIFIEISVKTKILAIPRINLNATYQFPGLTYTQFLYFIISNQSTYLEKKEEKHTNIKFYFIN